MAGKWRWFFAAAVCITVAALIVSRGDLNAAQDIPKNPEQDRALQYKSVLVQNGVWRIGDNGGVSHNEDMYLIEGSDKAVLIDTGMGKGDLAGFIKSLTWLPVEIAITHGHGDHVGQLDQFPDSVVYMSVKDKAMLPKTLNTSNFRWVKDGDIIDLGSGRNLEVMEIPGHTDGSLFFLDRAGKTLAVGDAVGSGSYVWKFTGSPSLVDYRNALKRAEGRLAEFNSLTLLVGHYYQMKTPLVGTAGRQMITDMRILCDKVIDGEIKGSPVSVNLGQRKLSAFTASYGLAEMWYDPQNIQPAR
jgi:hydroxyacylglutathione hydrolase